MKRLAVPILAAWAAVWPLRPAFPAADPDRPSAPALPPAASEPAVDPFQEALLRLIAQATREGKKVTVNRTRSLSGEVPLRPFGLSQPASTSLIAVEIRGSETAPGPSLESLLRAQEAVLAALAVVCRGQEGLGGGISRLAGQNEGLSREMRDLSAGVGEVREGVAGNWGQTEDIAAIETDNASLLAALASQVKALGQTVSELVSGMGAVGEEVSALLAAAGEEGGETEGGKGEEEGEAWSGGGEASSTSSAADCAPADAAVSEAAPAEDPTAGGEE